MKLLAKLGGASPSLRQVQQRVDQPMARRMRPISDIL